MKFLNVPWTASWAKFRPSLRDFSDAFAACELVPLTRGKNLGQEVCFQSKLQKTCLCRQPVKPVLLILTSFPQLLLEPFSVLFMTAQCRCLDRNRGY